MKTVANIGPSKSSNASWSATFTEFSRHGTGRSFPPWKTGTTLNAGSMVPRDVRLEIGLSKSDALRESAFEERRSKDGVGMLIADTRFRNISIHTKMSRAMWVKYISIVSSVDC